MSTRKKIHILKVMSFGVQESRRLLCSRVHILQPRLVRINNDGTIVVPLKKDLCKICLDRFYGEVVESKFMEW